MNAPYVKDPDSDIDFSVNWDDGYLQTGEDESPTEIISASSWSIEPNVSGDLDVRTASFTDAIATCWVTGGVKGQRYRLRNQITTSEGRIDIRTLTIFVRPE